jgi:DNA repair exonuclease SbcCD ATPase subunit
MSLQDMFRVSPANPVSNNISTYRVNRARLDLSRVERKLAEMTGERNALLKQREEDSKTMQEAQKTLTNIDKVIVLLESVSDLSRQEAKGYIEDMVSQALNVVHGGDHHFVINLKTGKNGPEVEYWLDSGEAMTQLKRPDYDRGGGKIDIISITLRLSLFELTGAEGPIMFDECGHNVSKEAMPHMAYFLKEYGTKFDRQLILNTHFDDVAEIGDKAIHITQVAGVSEVQNNV